MQGILYPDGTLTLGAFGPIPPESVPSGASVVQVDSVEPSEDGYALRTYDPATRRAVVFRAEIERRAIDAQAAETDRRRIRDTSTSAMQTLAQAIADLDAEKKKTRTTVPQLRASQDVILQRVMDVCNILLSDRPTIVRGAGGKPGPVPAAVVAAVTAPGQSGSHPG